MKIARRSLKMVVCEDGVNYDARCCITSPDVLEKFIRDTGIADDIQENIVTLYLDNRNKVTGFEMVARGTQGSCYAIPSDIFRGALIAGAAGIIVAHNHPSGDTKPSDEDLQTAERLANAGNILGCPMKDFVIIGNTFKSFKKEGLIK